MKGEIEGKTIIGSERQEERQCREKDAEGADKSRRERGEGYGAVDKG